MTFASKVWKLLVGIKDGLSLVFLLLFFGMLYAVLTARPSPLNVEDGALLIELNGMVVEESTPVDPLTQLLASEADMGEYEARDIVHALDQAASDDRIKAVVLDLSGFMGGGHVHMQDIGAALDRVKAADKKVLTHAMAYGDDAILLAAHSSEVWIDPLGGAIIAGPGGNRLYYGELIKNLDINAHVYKVGTYKSAVEPYLRNDMSDAARENYAALYGSLWEEWQADVKKARPKVDLEKATATPVEWIQQAKGDMATAALSAGLVDKLGDKTAFGERVAEIVGEDEWDETPGSYAYTDLDTWLTDNPVDDAGSAIGVITIAGEIVDGEAEPGTAGGDRIRDLLDAALEQDLKALVVRVDSPGGSVTASEEIRLAILRHKAKDIPIAVSMGNVAASGGYWVATPADRIFAEPETITGSIGIFAVLPSFENLADKWGVSADGVKTTALSGQPDFVGGFNEDVDAILQASIENGYDDFITRVAASRKLSKERVDEIGQGRVWDGGTARQIGLVDQYGGIEDALAWAAEEAKIEGDDWHAVYLTSDVPEYGNLLQGLLGADTPKHGGTDMFAMVAARQQAILTQVDQDMNRLMSTRGMQAHCLQCPVSPRAQSHAQPHAEAKTGWFIQFLQMMSD